MIDYNTYSFRKRRWNITNTYTFLITSLIIILIPGTGVIYTISTGITEGRKKSLFAAVGCTLGIIPHLFMSITLSSLLMQMSNTFFTVIQLIGARYLLYLGAGMVFTGNKIDFGPSPLAHSTAGIICRGILINLLNPKLTLFFFSFLPQYLTPGIQNYVQQSFVSGLTFMLLTLLVFICYGVLAGTAKNFFVSSPGFVCILQKVSGILFIFFAIKLALNL